MDRRIDAPDTEIGRMIRSLREQVVAANNAGQRPILVVDLGHEGGTVSYVDVRDQREVYSDMEEPDRFARDVLRAWERCDRNVAIPVILVNLKVCHTGLKLVPLPWVGDDPQFCGRCGATDHARPPCPD